MGRRGAFLVRGGSIFAMRAVWDLFSEGVRILSWQKMDCQKCTPVKAVFGRVRAVWGSIFGGANFAFQAYNKQCTT